MTHSHNSLDQGERMEVRFWTNSEDKPKPFDKFLLS